jgi:hypothetical protein
MEIFPFATNGKAKRVSDRQVNIAPSSLMPDTSGFQLTREGQSRRLQADLTEAMRERG